MLSIAAYKDCMYVGRLAFGFFETFRFYKIETTWKRVKSFIRGGANFYIRSWHDMFIIYFFFAYVVHFRFVYPSMENLSDMLPSVFSHFGWVGGWVDRAWRWTSQLLFVLLFYWFYRMFDCLFYGLVLSVLIKRTCGCARNTRTVQLPAFFHLPQ